MRRKLAARTPAGVELEGGSCRYFRNRGLLQKYRDANLTAGHYQVWGRYDSGKPLNEGFDRTFRDIFDFSNSGPTPVRPVRLALAR